MSSEVFQRKYAANPFNPDDPREAAAEEARQAILSGYIDAIAGRPGNAPFAPDWLLGGLLVGVVQIMQASLKAASDDERDAAIRASIVQTAAWAVDHARSFEDLDPLPEA